ncbi:MAG: adenosyl-hopene transferase HpnH [Planctomycetota bacterium]
MRFPLSLTRSITAYLLRKRLAGQRRFPLVLMLEPLHACNLSCTGCGRIREYAAYVHRRLSVAQCLAASEECGAPIVSICGGEPLIYPEIGELLARLLKRRKHLYLCTNGLALQQKLPLLPRSKRLMLNVHLDGMEATHDRMAERAGVFAAAVEGIRAAKADGRLVYTNTTIYKDTDVHEIEVLLAFLRELRVDGTMISPAYGYQAVNAAAERSAAIFMSRDEVRRKFREGRPLWERFRLTASPIYLDFLCGARELPCAAWASPTYNVLGWRGPCYLVAEAHHATYAELIAATDWQRWGPGRDPRCEHCLMHSGFEPAAVLSTKLQLRDTWAMARWQLG